MALFVSSLNSSNRFLNPIAIICLVCMSISACSGASSTKGLVQHIHPENACLGARSHAHPGGDKAHEHKLKCDASVPRPSNAHTHPATKGRRSIRHVHPNGANKHTHNRLLK